MKLLKIKRISKPVALIKLLPNIVTLFGLMIGISSIKFALDGKWEFAVYAIVISAIFDGVDGSIARMLNATSSFGAELDTLCDFANFGVAPSVLIYLWSIEEAEFKPISWAAMLLFIVCMVIRLARFNITSEKTNPLSKYFSIGVPAPLGALLALMPIILEFEISQKLGITFRNYTFFINMYIACIAFLLASRIPTFILKNIHIKPEYLSFFMIVSSIIIINLIIYTWYSLTILIIIYIISIPISALIARKISA